MASTEVAREHPLGMQHLAGCIALSQAANWNQNAADWRLMLEIGRGYGLTLADGTLAATTIALPYAEQFAWVSMVLVLPEHRRKGYATQLLKRALADLGEAGSAAVLDATPAGHDVYAAEGFRDTWGFKRFVLKDRSDFRFEAARVRALQPADWAQVAALDREAFGADRVRLLQALAARLPQAALVCESAKGIAGFVVGREGREANQIGPLVAHDGETARALLASACSRVATPVYIDLVDREAPPAAFSFQRPFTRMVRGAARAPGNASLVYCPAGPELG
ncbi:MAG TPA: GNAT family N-acetyltransferase [Burkholderiales bacterium]|nr:GNAT family N-acetyltransferase [Burkholderiales bacterium]